MLGCLDLLGIAAADRGDDIRIYNAALEEAEVSPVFEVGWKSQSGRDTSPIRLRGKIP